MICQKCGAENQEESVFCNKCGEKLLDEINVNTDTETNAIEVVNEPVSMEEQNFNDGNVDNKKSRKKLKTIIIIILLLIGAIAGYKQYCIKKAAQYGSDLEAIVTNIQGEAVKAEAMACTYSDVWSRAINSDVGVEIDGQTAYTFNRAIKLQKELFEKKGDMKNLQDGKVLSESKMKLLNEPPEEYKEAYQIVFEMYGYYVEYESLAESPTGSLVTFNQKTNELSSAIVKKLQEFEIKMPSK